MKGEKRERRREFCAAEGLTYSLLGALALGLLSN
jgi:hypothetical protein